MVAGPPPTFPDCPGGVAPATWIVGSANDEFGRGAWYSFTTLPAANTYTITTRVDYTVFDNYLNLFVSCPPNQTVYDDYQLFGVDDGSVSNTGNAPGAGSTITATVDNTVGSCGYPSTGYCSSMTVTGLAPATTYYVLANSYSDPGVNSAGGIDTTFTDQLTFGIAVLTGSNLVAQQVDVGPNPCCYLTPTVPGGACTALPTPTGVSPSATGTATGTGTGGGNVDSHASANCVF
jgi:hypothetical protein